jgi:hypothetical protein
LRTTTQASESSLIDTATDATTDPGLAIGGTLWPVLLLYIIRVPPFPLDSAVNYYFKYGICAEDVHPLPKAFVRRGLARLDILGR